MTGNEHRLKQIHRDKAPTPKDDTTELERYAKQSQIVLAKIATGIAKLAAADESSSRRQRLAVRSTQVSIGETIRELGDI